MNPVAVAKPSMRAFLGLHEEVRNVREFVARVAGGCPGDEDVILLACQISTNAMVHTASGKGGTFAVVVHPLNGMVRVEVHDGGSESSPNVRTAGELAGSGRGLGLVESLATRWGHLGDQNGRVVWFEVDWQ